MRAELSKKCKANMKANKNLIIERTDENRNLIEQLNFVRKEQSVNMTEIHRLDKIINETTLKRNHIENA